MRTRLRHLWEELTTGYWFVPAIMMVAAAVAAFLLLYLDNHVVGANVSWLYGGGADGAKTLLSTVAGSVITVAGVVFSITIAALTQASSQFGPRLLRNFMRDKGNQAVLGTFVATFVYCLLVLRTIHGAVADGVAYVPHASVTVAVLMAAASIAVLVYFIHHVSISLQAPAVIAAVLADLQDVLKQLPDRQHGSADPITAGAGLPSDFADVALPIAATSEGYIQVIDYDGLTQMAECSDLLLQLLCRPGDYVIEGTPLLRAWPPGRCADAPFAQRANAAFICGRQTTPEQDVEHALRQIVEVAVRALSPGINDPFTAINCIDALGSAVCRIARCGLPGPARFDRLGKLRIITPVTTFDGVVDTAFHQIRQYARGSVAVTLRLLEVIAACAERMPTDGQRQPLLRHADMIFHQGEDRDAFPEESDRAEIRARWEHVRKIASSASAHAGSPPC